MHTQKYISHKFMYYNSSLYLHVGYWKLFNIFLCRTSICSSTYTSMGLPLCTSRRCASSCNISTEHHYSHYSPSLSCAPTCSHAAACSCAPANANVFTKYPWSTSWLQCNGQLKIVIHVHKVIIVYLTDSVTQNSLQITLLFTNSWKLLLKS